jgi:hypothetical protein
MDGKRVMAYRQPRWITAEEAAGFVDLLAHEAEPWVDPVEVPPTTGDPKDEELVAFHRK